MIEVGDAIMESGGTGELEKLLEVTHGSLEEMIRMSVLEKGENFGKREDRKETGERRVGSSVEKSLVMLEIFRCV
jgi:hypothetical protein